jgi:hypothetical protein
MILHRPVLSHIDLGVVRSPGAGLGNLLLPIARALVGRERHGGGLVYPTFRQFKIGPYLRAERDKRTYGDVFRNRTLPEWRLWVAAHFLRQVDESMAPRELTSRACINYSGLARYFHDIMGCEQLVGKWLRENACLDGSLQGNYDIGVHVRLGDFKSAAAGPYDGHSVRNSFDWYRRAVADARRLVTTRHPRIMVFTDEDPALVTRELKLNGDSGVDPGRNAITSILNLSRAEVLVTSRSTFSAWAAYLGGGAAIWSAGFDGGRALPHREGLDFSCE